MREKRKRQAEGEVAKSGRKFAGSGKKSAVFDIVRKRGIKVTFFLFAHS